MAYEKITFVNDGPPAISDTNLNKMQTQYDEVKDELLKQAGADIKVDARNVINGGAGSGLDADTLRGKAPEDIGPKFVKGSYVGDAVDGRTIAVGFQADHIAIFSVDSPDAYDLYSNARILHYNAGDNHTVSDKPFITATGFTLGGGSSTNSRDGANRNGTNYVWFAWKVAS